MPVSPLTLTCAPSGMRVEAPVADTTHGMPSSLLTMTAWLMVPPTSTTTGDTPNRRLQFLVIQFIVFRVHVTLLDLLIVGHFLGLLGFE